MKSHRELSTGICPWNLHVNGLGSKCSYFQETKVNINNGKSDWYLSLIWVWWKWHFTFVVFLPKTYNPSLIMRKVSDKSQLSKTFCKIPNHYSSKCLRSWKKKKEKWSKMEETKETWWLTAMWYPGTENELQ